ncbi:hypothetical protein RQP46_010716 [Phenoliferia psychrophenolica]
MQSRPRAQSLLDDDDEPLALHTSAPLEPSRTAAPPSLSMDRSSSLYSGQLGLNPTLAGDFALEDSGDEGPGPASGEVTPVPSPVPIDAGPQMERSRTSEGEEGELYIPGLTLPTLFGLIPMTDTLSTLVDKYIPPQERPPRDLTGEAWKRDPLLSLDSLITNRSWRAVATFCRDAILAADPTLTSLILSHWVLRLHSLLRLHLIPLASLELSSLLSLLPPDLFHPAVPFELYAVNNLAVVLLFSERLDDALQEQLEATDVAPPGLRREHFRTVYEWCTEHTATAFGVFSLPALITPFTPLVKLVLGIAVLSADGKKAVPACKDLLSRLVEIHESSLRLRAKSPEPETARKPIDDAIESIMIELSDFVTRRLRKTIETHKLEVIVPPLVPPRACLKKLEGLPHNLQLFGREADFERTLQLLTECDDQNVTGHVALIGLGGIGKTSLATQIAHHYRSKVLGNCVFIRCERLDTLEAFQKELLRLRAPDGLEPWEELGQAVRDELERAPLLLILDNLLDSTDATAHATYLEFIDSLASIPSLTLLITSRNRIFTSRKTSRSIHEVQLDTLTIEAAEQLFRKEYGRVDTERPLQQDEPDLPELLELLEGIPLAIVLVAAHARKAQSVADVIRRWKDGRAWDNGAQGRKTSLDFSLLLSFKDPIIDNSDTLTLLRLLAQLPEPVLRRRGAHSKFISQQNVVDITSSSGIDAIMERLYAQKGTSRS